jgi:hypothetical protein
MSLRTLPSTPASQASRALTHSERLLASCRRNTARKQFTVAHAAAQQGWRSWHPAHALPRSPMTSSALRLATSFPNLFSNLNLSPASSASLSSAAARSSLHNPFCFLCRLVDTHTPQGKQATVNSLSAARTFRTSVTIPARRTAELGALDAHRYVRASSLFMPRMWTNSARVNPLSATGRGAAVWILVSTQSTRVNSTG